MDKTIYSPSKYVRILSVSSSIYITYTFGRIAYLNIRSKIFNYPKGTFIGLPWIGSLVFAQDMCSWLYELGKIGPVSMTQYGFDNYVYINDAKLLKDKNYTEMVARNSIDLWKDGINQFFLIGNQPWRKRRKIATHAFNSLYNSKYLGIKYIEILNKRIFPKWDKLSGNGQLCTTMRNDMQYLVFSMIYSSSFGHESILPTQDDPTTQRFFHSMHYLGNKALLTGIFLGLMVPSVKIANFLNLYVFNIFDSAAVLDEIITQWIEEHKKNEKLKDSDYYVNRMLKMVENGTMPHSEMIRDVLSLFSAGIDTTSSTMEQGILYLIENPDLQDMLYDEIAQYVNKHGKFSIQHREELHKLKAFVFEVLRNVRHVLSSFPRYNDKKSLKIGGYNIPHGWYVSGNHWYVNHSDEYWEKPNQFYINHFLNEKNEFCNKSKLVVFGVGRRDCMGQSLAVSTLQVLFGNLLFRYKFFPKDNDLKAFSRPKIWANQGYVAETPFLLVRRN